LKKENKKLQKEVENHKKNADFLSNAKLKGIEVSDNLDGKVMEDGISFHPAKKIYPKMKYSRCFIKKMDKA